MPSHANFHLPPKKESEKAMSTQQNLNVKPTMPILPVKAKSNDKLPQEETKLEKAKQERPPVVVSSKSYAEPPEDIQPEAIYIVSNEARGIWEGQVNSFAQLDNEGTWHFAVPTQNAVVYVQDEGIHYRWSGVQFEEEIYLAPRLRTAMKKRGVAKILDGINDLATDAADYEAQTEQSWQNKLDTAISTFEGTVQSMREAFEKAATQQLAEIQKANQSLNQNFEQAKQQINQRLGNLESSVSSMQTFIRGLQQSINAKI